MPSSKLCGGDCAREAGHENGCFAPITPPSEKAPHPDDCYCEWCDERPDAAPPKEVLKGIEEAKRGEGRYLNDDEMEVMPNETGTGNSNSVHVNGAPSEPQPCPFCGAEAHIIEPQYKGAEFQVGCSKADTECPVTPFVDGETLEQATNLWNHRARTPEMEPLTECPKCGVVFTEVLCDHCLGLYASPPEVQPPIEQGVFYTDPEGLRIESARRLCDAYHFALIRREADSPVIRTALGTIAPPPGAGAAEQWFWQRVVEELDTYKWSP